MTFGNMATGHLINFSTRTAHSAAREFNYYVTKGYRIMDDENFKSKLLRYGFNLFPPFRSSGAWLTQIGADIRYVRLKIPLKLKTRNYVGTLCGGNMYSAVDGVYMVMLIKNLGNNYLVWDKVATIRFKKPAKGTLFAEFRLTEGELQEIKHEVARQGKVDREYLIQLVDESDTVCAEVIKTIHIKQKIA